MSGIYDEDTSGNIITEIRVGFFIAALGYVYPNTTLKEVTPSYYSGTGVWDVKEAVEQPSGHYKIRLKFAKNKVGSGTLSVVGTPEDGSNYAQTTCTILINPESVNLEEMLTSLPDEYSIDLLMQPLNNNNDNITYPTLCVDGVEVRKPEDYYFDEEISNQDLVPAEIAPNVEP